ncbi:hypothetical protein [Streptomyces sp. NPDC005017]|uniref:hypothetical protein n=1 Tax=Streptomyces sp. NPDC005017 TaxID=3364706 RepID=UPI0036A65FA0
MRALTASRCAAAFISLGTLLNLLVRGVDSAFVVPDALVGAVLAIGAVLPAGLAGRVLTIEFGAAAGVFTVATAEHVVHEESAIGSLTFALICAAMAGLLVRRAELPSQCPPPEPRAAETHARPE